MFRTVLFGVLLLWAGSAAAADQPVYGPPSAWVRPVPIPRNVAATDATPVQLLLADEQSNLGQNEDELYTERAQKILTPQGLNSFGVLSENWDPDTETLVIHRLDIIRGDTVINGLADGKKFTVLRRENNLELAMLDGRLTATIQPEGLQVGDIVVMAYTLHRHDPALQGMSTDMDRLEHVGIAGRVYYRTLWDASKPMRWRLTDGVPAPDVRRTDHGSELVINMENVEAPKPPRGAPPRFMDLGSLEMSEYADWNELSRRMAPLYAKAATLGPKSPLPAQIARIAAASVDPKVRAAMALRLVEDQTRYVFLGMNDGGLVPADADVTWSRRFGDCKGKTVLLIALLQGLGIDAEPALVSTSFGDGMDQRLPASWWFDHVIVRAQIAGKTYWLDGTRVGDRDLDDLVVPPFRWALPLQASGSGLAPLEPAPLVQPAAEETLVIDATGGPNVAAPTHIELIYRGEEAVQQRQAQAGRSRADYERYLHEFWTKAYPWLDLRSVTIPDEQATGSPKLSADGVAKMDWIAESDGARFYRVPATTMGADVSFKREPGPHQDAPYAVNYPLFVKTVRQIKLPADGNYLLVGPDIDKTLAGLALQRTSRLENSVLTVELTTRAVEREFPAERADADAAALRELATSGVSVVYQGGGAATSPRASRTDNSASDLAAAAQGDAAAQYRLSQMYEHGRGVPLDLATAVGWMRKAADQAYPKAEGELGTALLTGSGVPRDEAAALTWLRKGAGHGDALAQTNLAAIYASGAAGVRDDVQALALAKQSAAQGFTGGEYLLALFYSEGRGTPADPAEAMVWYRRAADQGYAKAQAQLGFAYTSGRGAGVDFIEAAKWYRKAADQGEPLAEAAMGAMYEHGFGVAPDYGLAMTWFQKAAERRYSAGYMGIAELYGGGLGVPKDPVKALEYVRKAADAGSGPAQYALAYAYQRGIGTPKDPQQSMVWLIKAVASGDAQAQAEMAANYAAGRGVPRDDAKAVTLFRMAAQRGSAAAEGALGRAYLHGVGGVPMDLTQAFAWTSKGAAHGDAPSEAELGHDYLVGSGVEKNPAKGLEWLTKSADRGFVPAMNMLGDAYRAGAGAPPDFDQAMTWYRKAADLGDAAGQTNVGMLFWQAKGRPRDFAQALIWLRKSAAQNYPVAERLLGLAYLNGLGVGADRALAESWFTKAAGHGDSFSQKQVAFLHGQGPAPELATGSPGLL